jgi:hypothetical protein
VERLELPIQEERLEPRTPPEVKAEESAEVQEPREMLEVEGTSQEEAPEWLELLERPDWGDLLETPWEDLPVRAKQGGPQDQEAPEGPQDQEAQGEPQEKVEQEGPQEKVEQEGPQEKGVVEENLLVLQETSVATFLTTSKPVMERVGTKPRSVPTFARTGPAPGYASPEWSNV